MYLGKIYISGMGKGILISCMIVISLLKSNSQNLQDGLVIYYKFDNNMADSSGNNNHANGVNFYYSTSRFNVTNQAIHFNGVNARVLDIIPSYFSDRASVSAWFKTEDSRNQSIVSKYDANIGKGFEIGTTPLGEVYLKGENGKGDLIALKSSPGLYTTGMWHHIVGIVNDSLWQLYLDGQLVNFVTTENKDIDLSNDMQISVGFTDFGILFGDPMFFLGSIDDVRLYNRSLTPEEVLLLYDYNCDLNIISSVVNASSTKNADGKIELSTSGGQSPCSYIWNTGESTSTVTGLPLGKYSVNVTDAVGCSKLISVNVDAPEKGLIAYYPFNGDANDYSGNKNHGIEHSHEVYSPGVKNGSHDFNGFSDYLELTNTLDITYGLSFSFWIKPRGRLESELNEAIVSKYRTIFTNKPGLNILSSNNHSKENIISASFYNTIDNYDHVRSKFIDYDTATFFPFDEWIINEQKSMENNKWKHCVINNTSTELQLWIDGKMISKKTKEYSTYFNSTIEPTYVGNAPFSGNGSDNHYNGELDELRIYDRELSEQEILELYTDICNIEINSVIADETYPGAGDGNIELTVTGGSQQYKYEWNTADTTDNLLGITAGTYNVTVTDSFSCKATDTITVASGPCNLQLSYTSENLLIPGQPNADIDLTVTGGVQPYSFNWSNGEVLEDITVNTEGYYYVIVSDGAGCTAEDTILIEEISCDLQVSYQKTDASTEDEYSGSIDLTIKGGEKPYSILWNTNDTTEYIQNLSRDVYTVIVIDKNGCTESEAIFIGSGECDLFISYKGENVSAHGKSDGTINLTVVGGTGPYSYNWNTGDTVEDLQNLPIGIYLLTITDANGCSDEFVIAIDEPHYSISGTVYKQTSVLEKGKVILYRFENNSYAYISETEVKNGVYSFTGIVGGTYILLAIPYDTNSGYLPTYRVNKQYWEEANKTVVTGDMIDADIRLIPKEPTDVGSGRISGRVLIETPEDKLPGSFVPVHLVNNENEYEISTVSDSMGYFNFTNIPFNMYEVYAQRPGFKCVGDVNVKLDTEIPNIGNVGILIRGNDILITVNKDELPGNKIFVYPTFVKDYLTIDYALKKAGEEMNIVVYSAKSIIRDKYIYFPPSQKGSFTIPVSHLWQGAYFVDVTYNNTKEVFPIVK